MLDLNLFATEVHENAKAHGWWDEPRTFPEICALIHSEWSEAVEAYRNREGMIWFDHEKGNKPDGVAVELIDGCIRIMDWMGRERYAMTPDTIRDGYKLLSERRKAQIGAETLPELVARLHMHTSDAYVSKESSDERGECLQAALITACYWLSKHDIDPEDVLMIKHEYNKTRPYRHGGKAL